MRISALLTFLIPLIIVFSSLGLVVTGYGKGWPAYGLIKTRLAQASCGGGVNAKSESLTIMDFISATKFQ